MSALSPKPIYLSMLLALLCQLLPWAGFGLMLRPDFILLVVIYWLLRAPNICNIGTAWMAGLVVDLASGGLFWQNGAAYAATPYFAVSYHRRLALFNIWQQASYVFVLLLLTQITLLILKMFAGGEIPGWSYFLPSISGILLWQLVIFSRIGVDAPPHKN
jgi:rod shape-determining protein MreD